MNDEFRRVRRRKVPDTVQVVDTMTERVVGRLSNLSESGMLLMASVPLVDDALYQFRFNLSRGNEAGATIEVGAHLLWQDAASAPGQTWSQMQHLRDWLDMPGGSYE